MECERCGNNFGFLIQCIHQTKHDGPKDGTFVNLCQECVELCVRRVPSFAPAPPNPGTVKAKDPYTLTTGE
jgi:hypothetical protein